MYALLLEIKTFDLKETITQIDATMQMSLKQGWIDSNCLFA